MTAIQCQSYQELPPIPSWFKYSVASLGAAAITAIFLGAIAYSGSGLSAIGNGGSIAMMVSGSAIISGELCLLYLLLRGRKIEVLSFADYEIHKNKLQAGERFVFLNNLPPTKFWCVCYEVREGGALTRGQRDKIVSLKELQARS